MNAREFANLRRSIQDTSQRIAALQSAIVELKRSQSRYTRVEDIKGVHKPFIADIRISLGATLTPGQGVYTVPADGPFVVSAIAAFWRETTEARFRQISSVVFDNETYGASASNAIDFEWKIESSASGQLWQNDDMPSSLLFCNRDRPHYLAAPAFLSPRESIFVTITPIVAQDAAGVLHFDLIGFRILKG